MSFCPNCGAQNNDTAQFCVQCGDTIIARGAAKSGGVEYGHTTSSAIGALISSLDVGSKVTGAGALLAFIGFFLPIYTYTSTAGWYNGIKIGGAAWLQPLFALLLIGLVYIAFENDLKTKIMSAAIEASIGMIYAPQIFIIFKGSSTLSSYSIGYYFIAFGFAAVVVGAFTRLNEITQNLR